MILAPAIGKSRKCPNTDLPPKGGSSYLLIYLRPFGHYSPSRECNFELSLHSHSRLWTHSILLPRGAFLPILHGVPGGYQTPSAHFSLSNTQQLLIPKVLVGLQYTYEQINTDCTTQELDFIHLTQPSKEID